MSGLLFDIHPAPEHKPVTVLADGKWTQLGEVERTADILADIRAGEAVVSRTVEAEMFTPRNSSEFTRTDYFQSSDDWAEYLLRPRTNGFAGDQSLLTTALKRLDAGEECLRLQPDFRIFTFTKSAATPPSRLR